MVQNKEQFRLVTKGDFDGVVSASLLKHLGLLEEIKFVHPREIETGEVEITGKDITVGLPYKKSAYLAFDNYPGSASKILGKNSNLICDPKALSTSRVVFNHFGGQEKFPHITKEMMREVGKGFSARFNRDEVLYPSAWGLLNFLIDQRTGLDKFKDFSVPQHQMLLNLIEYCQEFSVLEILSKPEIEERIDVYFANIEKCKAQILRCASVHYNLVAIDMRNEEVIYPGNRFVIYALFPECNVSLHLMPTNKEGKFTCVSGKSIIDRTYRRNIGKIMVEFGGGGHANAGTCQVNGQNTEEILDNIIDKLSYNFLQNLYFGYF